MRSDEFNKTVLAIYDAAFDPTLWPSVLERISDHTNSGATTLLTANVETGNQALNYSARSPEEVMEGYMRDYYATDLRVPKLFDYRVGEAILSDAMLTEDEALANRELHSFFAGFELANMTGSNLSLNSNLTWLGTARGKIHQPYTSEELTNFENLLPHVRKSVRMHLTLLDMEARSASLESIWNLSKSAVLFLNDNWKVSFCNEAAIRLTDLGLLSIANDDLRFSARADQVSFRRCCLQLQSAHLETPGFVDSLLATDSAFNQYGVRLFQLPGERPYMNYQHSAATYMVTIVPLSSPDQVSRRDLTRFCALFKITDAEQDVVLALLNSIPLQSLAEQHGKKIDTVRKQLRSVMLKTGVQSQKQLVQLVERFTFLGS
ncbi:MAG: helix-turn-helix transcriptional regulator [Hyphomicrobiaceae bacterium]